MKQSDATLERIDTLITIDATMAVIHPFNSKHPIID